jgi:hypothetical protein
MKRLLASILLALTVSAGVATRPAHGVVHEIYAAWCAGQGEIEPPGISDGSKKNFARPVLAGGVVSLTPYLDGMLVDFDFEKAQAKIVPAPVDEANPPIIPIGPGLYLERFIIDPQFPAFLNCAKLQSLAG